MRTRMHEGPTQDQGGDEPEARTAGAGDVSSRVVVRHGTSREGGVGGSGDTVGLAVGA